MLGSRERSGAITVLDRKRRTSARVGRFGTVGRSIRLGGGSSIEISVNRGGKSRILEAVLRRVERWRLDRNERVLSESEEKGSIPGRDLSFHCILVRESG